MRRWTQRLTLVPVFVLAGCLLDIAPAREPIDETWKEHMLAGEYGEWFYGKKSAFVGRDEIRSWPGGASGTRYGISVSEESALWGGAWSMKGGLVGRVVLAKASVELFGKDIARIHGPWHTVTDRDYSYEFFLVVRPTAPGRGRLIRQWNFPREDLGLTVPPVLERNLRAQYSGAELEEKLEYSKGIFINGFLSFDEQGKTATVTITGLVRPFEERVDLSGELRQ